MNASNNDINKEYEISGMILITFNINKTKKINYNQKQFHNLEYKVNDQNY